MTDIRAWLAGLGLESYADVFESNGIEPEVFSELTDADLKDLGVLLGHRRKILKAMRAQHQEPREGDFAAAVSAEWRSPSGRTPEVVSSAPLSYTPRHLAERILTERSSLEGERKPVTVLFADVAGFTTLSDQLDPEAVHNIMDGCFAILSEHIHQYEGTINQYTGDGIMALFGAPIAHEDHALRAAHAALGIQQALVEYGAAVEREWGVSFRMRIGLNTGPVVVGRISDDLRMDYTAQGDTVNLAARMQQIAEPRTIYATEATHRNAGDGPDWVSLGPREVRGKSAPVSVYHLVGHGTTHGRFDVLVRRGLTPLVGRQDEIVVLANAWTASREGSGRVVSIVGEAGLGKSRLIYEFKHHLERERAQIIEGTCFTYGNSISYLPFLHIVRGLCRTTEADDEVATKRKIAATLDELGQKADRVAPYLHNILSYHVEDEAFARLTPELVQRRTVEALTTLLVAAAKAAPLAVIVEDVHWIDKATEEVIGALVEALSAVPMLLLLVYRPEYLHQWGEKAHHAEVVLRQLPSASGAAMVRAVLTKPYADNLARKPLTADQSASVARRILGESSIPPELERLIVDRTEGNPLFVEELTRGLLESGALKQDGGTYLLTRPVHELKMPATLQGVLLARIDRLSNVLKETLQVASAIGRLFSQAVLAKASLVKAPVDGVLLRLQDLEFVYPVSLGPQREYSFKHVLVQEAVYSTLLKSKRAAFHEAIGRAIEALYPDRLEEFAEVLAHHYDEAGNADRALTYLELANAKAARGNAIVEAKRYFDRAYRLFDALPNTAPYQKRRINLTVRNIIVFQLQFMLREYYEIASECRVLAESLDDRPLLGKILARLGQCEWSFGRLQDAQQKFTQVIPWTLAAQDYEELSYNYMTMIWGPVLLAQFEEIPKYEALALQIADKAFNLRWHAWVLTGASLCYAWTGDFDAAVSESKRALATAEEYGDDSMVTFSLWVMSHAYTCKGDLESALRYGLRGVEVAPTPADRAWASGPAAWAMCHAGQTRQGLEILEQVVAANRAGGFVFSEMLATWMADGYVQAGRYDDARRTIGEVIEYCQRAGMQYQIAMAQRLWGEVERAGNAVETALDSAIPHYRSAVNICRKIGAQNELAHSLAALGLLQIEHRDRQAGVEHLKEALSIYERLGTLHAPDKVRAALAHAGVVL